jgi:hypothetical protein
MMVAPFRARHVTRIRDRRVSLHGQAKGSVARSKHAHWRGVVKKGGIRTSGAQH